jgi:MFS family permease
MMTWSAAPFIGPVLGPLISGFINQHTNWRWTYYVVIIWAAAMLALLIAFVPETFNPELLRRRAGRLRKGTGEERWIAPMEKLNRTFLEALKKSIKTPFSEPYFPWTVELCADGASPLDDAIHGPLP